jgi:AraC-like DNA-binding protein
MNAPGDADTYITLDQLCPAVDLASFWHYRQDIWHKYRIQGHHFLLIESGRIEARTPQGRFVAKAGDMFCFRPTELNEYGNFGATLFYQAHINFAPPPREHVSPWLDEAGPLPVKLSTGAQFNDIRQVLETMCIELGQSGAVHRLRVRAAVFELLALIAKAMAADKSQPDLKLPKLDEWQRVRLRLGSELTTEISIAGMADKMGLSVDHFIRQFKQRFGMAPKAFRTHAKVREAARLLRSGGQSIKSVAYALGFSDTKAFTRMFKKHMGVVPSEFQAAPQDQPVAAEQQRGRLYPVNQHVVPPHAGPDWFKKWHPRR